MKPTELEMLPEQNSVSAISRKGPVSEIHVNLLENARVKKLKLRPAARTAFQYFGGQIYHSWRAGRPMAALRTRYGLLQSEIEILLREYTREHTRRAA